MKILSMLFIILFLATPAFAKNTPTVVINLQTLIYHRPECSRAKNCTKNCISIKEEEIPAYGARACKICGKPIKKSLKTK